MSKKSKKRAAEAAVIETPATAQAAEVPTDQSKPEQVIEQSAAVEATPLPKKASKAGQKKGGTRLVRELVIQHPDWDKAQLVAAVQAAGFNVTPMTADVCRYEVLSTLAVLKDLGLLNVQ